MFYPPPEVDSIILRLKPWAKKPFEVKDPSQFVRLTKWLFTQRNKKLAKALTPFLKTTFKLNKQDAEKIAQQMPFHDKRPRELAPQDFGVIANALPN
jgi:16S rRNA A1518/A1519 N6-dimethyltransferase RsmA/KsgA/DIM1 with predicted DNA glycosylase/AP lyase activity